MYIYTRRTATNEWLWLGGRATDDAFSSSVCNERHTNYEWEVLNEYRDILIIYSLFPNNIYINAFDMCVMMEMRHNRSDTSSLCCCLIAAMGFCIFWTEQCKELNKPRSNSNIHIFGYYLVSGVTTRKVRSSTSPTRWRCAHEEYVHSTVLHSDEAQQHMFSDGEISAFILGILTITIMLESWCTPHRR